MNKIIELQVFGSATIKQMTAGSSLYVCIGCLTSQSTIFHLDM